MGTGMRCAVAVAVVVGIIAARTRCGIGIRRRSANGGSADRSGTDGGPAVAQAPRRAQPPP